MKFQRRQKYDENRDFRILDESGIEFILSRRNSVSSEDSEESEFSSASSSRNRSFLSWEC